MRNSDKRLIEQGFFCHQVGAETQRERDTGKAPPINRLHVWWARRPLTPSRAAVFSSLVSADTDPERFIRSLGIEKVQAMIDGVPRTLTGKLLERVKSVEPEREILIADGVVIRALIAEEKRRAENRELIEKLRVKDSALSDDPVILRWEAESLPLADPWPQEGDTLPVQRVMGDPAWAKEKMAFSRKHGIRFSGDGYGYDRAFQKSAMSPKSGLTVLDPTSGGGSIPFEALRLGYNVIANDLNPVATVILYATLDYPLRFGSDLGDEIQHWGERLLSYAHERLYDVFPDGQILPIEEQGRLRKTLSSCPGYFDEFNKEQIADFIYARQVRCPHCGGDAPLLNTCWLSKQAADAWGVRIIPDGKSRNGKVRFETYRVSKGKGPGGEDPGFATVTRGVGFCVHCKQAISGDEIKAQARGKVCRARGEGRGAWENPHMGNGKTVFIVWSPIVLNLRQMETGT